MSNCYVCNIELTEENKTEEHILLNSLGGRLKSTKLICKKCNSTFGNKIDSQLSDQFNFFANLLMIKRDRGNPPPIRLEVKATGDKVTVDHEGNIALLKPAVSQKKIGDETEISIQTSDISQMKRILSGFQKKHPSIDVDKLLASDQIRQAQIDGTLHTQLVLGGKESLPAILKMAINYYIEITGDIQSVSSAIEDLKSNDSQKVEPIFLKDRLFELDEAEVTHSIFINGDKCSRRLYAIIELFSSFQYIIKLSDTYTGEDYSEIYAYDVINCAEVEKTPINTPSHDFIFTYRYSTSKPDFSLAQESIERVVKIAMERQLSSNLDELSQKSFLNGVDPNNQSDGVNGDVFVSELLNRLQPYLLSRLPKPNR